MKKFSYLPPFCFYCYEIYAKNAKEAKKEIKKILNKKTMHGVQFWAN
jgi:hypothetical protein